MKKLSIAVKTALLFVISIMATGANAQLSEWENYTSTDWIRGMAIKDNALWLATEGGLVKFNTNTGETTIYNRANAPVPENDILSVACNGNTVWLGTNRKGIAKLENNTLTAYNKQNSGIFSDYYNMQFAFDGLGNTWVGGLLSFYKFNGNKWVTYTTPELQISSMATVNAFALDNDGKLWFGGMNILKDNVFGYYSDATGVVWVGGINNISSMAIDKDGNKWMSTTKSGIAKYDGNTFTQFNSKNSQIPSDNTMALTIDGNGKIWFGSDTYLVSYDGKTFVKQAIPTETKYDAISSLLADGDKIWIGSRRSGLYKYEDGKIAHIDVYKSIIPTNNVDSATTVAKNGEIWIGTSSGLIHIDKDNQRTTMLESNDTVNKIKTIAVDKAGSVWVAMHFTDTCLMKITEKDTVAFLTSNCPVTRNSVTSLTTDENNVLWVGTDNGLLRYDGKEWKNFNEGDNPAKGANISLLATDSKNNLWCGVENKGLLYFDGTNWEEYNKENSSLPMNLIRSIAVDKNDRLWIASGEKNMGPEFGGGLTCFDGKDWKTYDRYNSGLPSNTITSIAFDANGNIWLGTYGNVGVTMFDGKDTWEVYSTDNSGIADNDISKISIDTYRNTIWLNSLRSRGISVAQIEGTVNGISAIKKISSDGKIYDLSGLKVTHPTKGNVYIRNGRKYIEK